MTTPSPERPDSTDTHGATQENQRREESLGTSQQDALRNAPDASADKSPGASEAEANRTGRPPTQQSGSSADQSATSETVNEATEQHGAKRPSKLRLKIGSLRDSRASQDAKPRPVNPAYSGPSKFELPRPDQTPGATTRLANSASDTPKGALSAQPPVKPSQESPRQESSSQLSSPEQTETPQQETTPQKSKYPPPNLRHQLSEDLQRELDAVLGDESMESLLAAPGATETNTNVSLESESRLRARVVSVHRDDVFLDLGGRNQGIASLRHFPDPPRPGAVVDVIVGRYLADDELYEVTPPGTSVNVGDWSSVAEGMVVDTVVTGHNKGGLECTVGNLRGFIPAGQVAPFYIEDLAEFVGQKFACVVTEANPERRNLVLSRRAVLERENAERKETLLSSLSPGQKFTGTVKSLHDFGAFVDLGGVDGLIHVSKLSWERLAHAGDVLQVGQPVNVTVEKYDATTGRISLNYNDRTENPWTAAAAKYPATSTAKGKVSKLTEFGAFVRLEPGIEGLVHISELSHRHVRRASDVVHEGQQVEVQVLSVDADAQRMSLSIKALETSPGQSTLGDDEDDSTSDAQTAKSKRPKINPDELRGGLGHGAGGDRFGLKW